MSPHLSVQVIQGIKLYINWFANDHAYEVLIQKINANLRAAVYF